MTCSVSFRHLDSVLPDRHRRARRLPAGEVVWKLGGKDSDFTFPDDPDHGPCAQHAATMLPNGHVMVFDNGSGLLAGNLCVDPANPSGPSVARPHTRVVEYALDTAAGTASVAWSHTPPVSGGEQPWYAWFMGSARRVADGHTLIGWSAETRALATEVAADGDELWRLRLAEPKPNPPFISYRASLMQARDAEAPVLDGVSLADGATYVEGQQVAVDFRCRDRGGSSLRSCAGDLRPGGVLDTSTPGPHTVHLTARDGAGNTTTVTRSYTVAALFQPGWSQDRIDKKLRGQRVSATVRLVNDGVRADAFRLKGTRGNAGFRVRYKLGGRDVTNQVVRGRLHTDAVDPGCAPRAEGRGRADRPDPARRAPDLQGDSHLGGLPDPSGFGQDRRPGPLEQRPGLEQRGAVPRQQPAADQPPSRCAGTPPARLRR